MHNKNYIKTFFIVLFFFFVSAFFVNGQECKNSEECQKKIAEYEKKVAEVREQKNTLASHIQLMNNQIQLTTLKIVSTEHAIITTGEEIEDLNTRIGALNESLDYLGTVLLAKIAQGYKNHQTNIFDILLTSQDAATLTHRVKYLKTVQDTDRRMAFKVQQAKDSFEEQKKLREEKKVQLDALKETLGAQTVTLTSQKQSKQKLLEVTKNDERTYQGLLDKLKSEYAAIQAIVSGAGNESLVREVKKGDSIASVIAGASCNSAGGHLHFIVKEGDSVVNPFSYLKPVDHTNCSGSSCGSSDGDPFNPSGSWDWPINPAIELEQGYGSTWAVRNSWVGRIYNFHNGIDINGSSNDVKAVTDGTLYRGSFSGSSGCALPYVKLVHKDSNNSSFYLHVYLR